MKFIHLLLLLLFFGCTSQNGVNVQAVNNSHTPGQSTIQPTTLSNLSDSNQSSVNQQTLAYALYIYYFYRDGCPFCQKTNPLVSQMENKYTNVKFYSLETGSNSSNLALFNKFSDAYNISESNRGVPIIFIDSESLQGEQTIITYFEGEIKACLKYPCEKDPGKIVH